MKCAHSVTAGADIQRPQIYHRDRTLAHFPKTQLLGIGLKKKVLLDCQTEKELLHGITV